MFRRHAVAVSSCRWQPLPAPLRAACSPGKREKARCRSTAATHRTNREKDNNEPTPCVRSLLFVYRQALKRKKNELMKPSTRSWWGKVDSLFCGKATPVATVHRTVAKSRLSSPFYVSRIQLFAFHFGLLLKWWAKMDSNHRPHDYQSCALAS